MVFPMLDKHTFHDWRFGALLLAISLTGCPAAETETADLPKPRVKTPSRSGQVGGQYDSPEAMTGSSRELAELALAPTAEVEEKRMATRGIVARAMGVAPGEIRETEADRFRMARVATVVRGTADLESVEQLRSVMRESNDPKVIGDSIRGLGHVRDIDSVPEMLDLLSHEDAAVREAAEYSVSRILGIRPAGGQPPAQFYPQMYRKLRERHPDLRELFKQHAKRHPLAGA